MPMADVDEAAQEHLKATYINPEFNDAKINKMATEPSREQAFLASIAYIIFSKLPK